MRRERFIMTDKSAAEKVVSSVVAGGVAAGAARAVIGSVGVPILMTVGGPVLVSTAPLVAGIGAAVAAGSFVSKLFDD